MIYIKLLRVYDGKPVGEIIEVADAVGRALIAGGVAEDATQTAEGVLVAAQTAELRAQMEGYTRAIADTFRAGVAEIRAARPDLGRIDPGESEDDKKLPTGGFRSLGHFGHDTFRGNHRGSPNPDSARRLHEYHELVGRVHAGNVTRGTASGLSESVDPDGGALIPMQFANGIWERARGMQMLADRINLMPISGNTMRLPGDAEDSRKDGSRRGGLQGYWEGEADQYIKSKPKFRHIDLRLKKLTLMAFATNEVLEDTGGALESYLNKAASEELVFKTNDGLVNGDGVGKLLGMLKAPCKVIVPAEAGQAVASLVAKNIINMWARGYAPCRANMAWFINQDIEPQLAQLTLATGTYSGQLVYMPPTGLSDSPYATLQGRPVIPIEQCQTLGTEGDIILADVTQYTGIKKASGVTQSVSMHLRFDYDETVFKFSLRMDAQPAWQSPLTPFKGTNTQSPIVTLATRP